MNSVVFMGKRTDKMKASDNRRKRMWVQSKGPEYAADLNERTKAYHETEGGKFAMKAGAANTRAKQASRQFKGVGYTKISAADMRAIWDAQGGVCAGCKTAKLDLYKKYDHVTDHIIPFSAGGAHAIDNIQFLCQDCNTVKFRAESADRATARRVARGE